MSKMILLFMARFIEIICGEYLLIRATFFGHNSGHNSFELKIVNI
jgi:hypothetical protein